MNRYTGKVKISPYIYSAVPSPQDWWSDQGV